MLRKGATLMCAAVGLLGTLGTSAATADTVEPLNQYVVSGKVDTDALARAGFDLREASVTGQKGKFFIVARAVAGRGAGEGRRHRDGAVRAGAQDDGGAVAAARRSRRTATTCSGRGA